METTRTETSSMSSWQQVGWKITPLNTVDHIVSAPAIFTDLKPCEAPDLLIMGNIEIAAPSQVYTIDRLTHENLLDQSFREYDDIWRTLAKE